MTTLAASRPRLRAVTRAISPPEDLLDALGPDGSAWLRDGSGFVTSGVAARVDVDTADAVLAALDIDDPLAWPGTGPLAVGALPFDPALPSSLVIPRLVVGRTADGRGWVTEVGDEPARPLAAALAEDEPTAWRVTSLTGRRAWRAMVRGALDAIDRRELAKVVLARAVVVEADAPFSPRTALRRLRRHEPGCFVHHAEGLVGASPELLVRRVGARVESRPLAGTAPADDEGREHLRVSGKDAHEHRLVVDGVVGALSSLCDDLEVAPAPTSLAFSSVVHLATPVRGRLRPPSPSALAVARRLHPTAAVAGTPRDGALRAIAALEDAPRGRYAGPVGWVDARGDGEWAVALRGAEIDGATAVLRAGAGIVAGSDPDAEWAETQVKLEPMLRALVAP
ncbi:MAG TPA: isochorismate synthase [Acidimicrobiia bacterium]|nr:isochorismate synthase [Acidimicrobiia bacterium]